MVVQREFNFSDTSSCMVLGHPQTTINAERLGRDD